MDLLCGCMSGKKSKSAGGKKAKKGKKADKPTVSTKGQTQHGGAEKGNPLSQNEGGPAQTNDKTVVGDRETRCTSTARTATSIVATTTNSTAATVTDKDGFRASSAVAADGSLLSEIEATLGSLGRDGSQSEALAEDTHKVDTQPKDTTTAEADSLHSPRPSSQSMDRPPEPASHHATQDGKDTPASPDEEVPPIVPPRPPQSRKTSMAEVEGPQGEGPEDSPPVLPPRSVLSSSSSSSPPPKPQRYHDNGSVGEEREEGAAGMRASKPLSIRKPPPLPNDWSVIELPKTDAELRKLTHKPEELANMAATYVTKHVDLHTDVRITKELNDQVRSAFLRVEKTDRNILQSFLTALIEEQSNSSTEDAQTAEPAHGALIILLKEILPQFADQEKVVEVSLVMLRAMSQVPKATQILVECQVTNALLGTMAAFKAAATVQRYCLDMLAKIALYHPSVTCKSPLNQRAVDLICVSLDTHPKEVTIAQSACKVLRLLATSLYTVANNTMDSGKVEESVVEEQQTFVTDLLTLLDYVFTKSRPVVQSALKCHSHDVTIKNDGRLFLFIYAKLEELRQRQYYWQVPCSGQLPPPVPSRHQAAEPARKEMGSTSEGTGEPGEEGLNHTEDYENWDLLRGVLRKKSTLTGHKYTKADLLFMEQLMKTQVVALVCSLAVSGDAKAAVALLDQPVSKMVQTPEVPPGVRDFVTYHCSTTDTLIDLDPGLFVALIDAVRYSKLSFEMAQKSVLKVAGALDDQQQVPVVAVTVEFLASTITHRPLAPAMTVAWFVTQVVQDLEKASEVSQNGAALKSLLLEIKQCARKSTVP